MLIYYFNEAVCNAQIIGQWWLWSFSLQVPLFGYECVFSFYSEKVGKPNTNQWLAYAVSFNLEGGLSYCLAVYNYLFIPLSSGGASCTEMQKSFFDEMVFEHCSLYSQNTTLRNNFGSIWKFCPPSFWHHD